VGSAWLRKFKDLVEIMDPSIENFLSEEPTFCWLMSLSDGSGARTPFRCGALIEWQLWILKLWQ
jgi:hypothetical protein